MKSVNDCLGELETALFRLESFERVMLTVSESETASADDIRHLSALLSPLLAHVQGEFYALNEACRSSSFPAGSLQVVGKA